MRITKYSDVYFDDVLGLVQKFHKEYLSAYFEECQDSFIVQTIKENSDNAFLLIVDEKCVGVLAGLKINSRFNSEVFFHEIIWYVEKPYGRYGVKLIKEAEKCLKSIGVSTIVMSVLERSKSEKIKRIYSKLGYGLEETHYMRKL